MTPQFTKNIQNSSRVTSYSTKLPKILTGNALHVKMQNDETNDEYFEDLSIQPDFNYYETHDFHKLAMKLDKRNSFSVLQTNICSLSTNLEN